MASQQSVKQQLLKIAGSWPKDLIRPNHQFSEAVTQIANAHPAWAEPSSSKASSAEITDGQAMAGALSRLLNNRAISQFPLTERTKKPPSMPKHYVNLMDGLRKAERGEREPWYKSAFRFRK